MSIRSLLSRVVALALVAAIALTGCGTNSETGLTGNYRQDTLTVIENLNTLIETPEDSPKLEDIRDTARQQINEYTAQYRRDNQVSGLRSFTTMQTALNSLAGFYSTYGERPLSDKLKKRLKQEFRDVEISLKRGF
ncbi:photosystem II protein Psb27 [Spirulina sp. CS-785/01]|uniref:photosystem II protein Psb27 n=1 Tax=Spirulina sp. CS-785/01 TaxID=3021716 RepID=UPI00232B3A18|nr:photosystem II protein Psb27 [Spirulina sp. CS-785/01]MDB9315899.1 photosystem II protein Psb27 [Spirulina sp. CS-785/01]